MKKSQAQQATELAVSQLNVEKSMGDTGLPAGTVNLWGEEWKEGFSERRQNTDQEWSCLRILKAYEKTPR